MCINDRFQFWNISKMLKKVVFVNIIDCIYVCMSAFILIPTWTKIPTGALGKKIWCMLKLNNIIYYRLRWKEQWRNRKKTMRLRVYKGDADADACDALFLDDTKSSNGVLFCSFSLDFCLLKLKRWG